MKISVVLGAELTMLAALVESGVGERDWAVVRGVMGSRLRGDVLRLGASHVTNHNASGGEGKYRYL